VEEDGEKCEPPATLLSALEKIDTRNTSLTQMSKITQQLPIVVLRMRCTRFSRKQHAATYFNGHVDEMTM
jgi:hypothetical protein